MPTILRAPQVAEEDPRRWPLPHAEPSNNPFNFQTLDVTSVRALVEEAPVGMFHADLVNGWIYRNQTLITMTGLAGLSAFESFEAMAARGSWIHPDDRALLVPEVLQAEQLRQPVENEFRIVKPDGTWTYVVQRLVPRFDAAGKPLSWTGSVVDISERKRVEVLERKERDQMLQLTTALGGATSENFFETLVEVLTQTLSADMAFVREYVESPRPHLRYVCGLAHGQYFPPYDQLLSLGELAALKQATKIAVAVDTTNNAMYPIMAGLGMQQVLIRSLHYADGRLLGTIVVSHHAPLDTEQTLQILDLFAVRAAAELERQHHQQALTAQRENLRWLNELSVRIHDSTNLEDIGRNAVASMAEHTSAPIVSIFLVDADPNTPVRLLGTNRNHQGAPRRYPLVNKVFELLHANHGVLFVNDLDSEVLALPDSVKVLERRGVVEMAVLLLSHGDHDLGLVILEYTAPGYVEQLDREILQALAKMLSLAFSNAQHFEDVEYKAMHDSLTGLFNRNVLHAHFDRHIGSHQNAALMLLDLDRFKEVNDTLGHNVGDQVLRQVADRLRENLGKPGALVCRLGGDEFAILLFEDALDGARTLMLGHKVLTSLQQPFLVKGTKLDIGASIGVALYPLHGDDSHALLRSADVAMYAAKHQRAGVCLYDPKLDTHTPERLGLMADLNDAIREGQLQLYYQPKLHLLQRKAISCEALVRWNHPRLGLLGPDSFIPLAEMSDAIHALTARVIEDACRQQWQWRSEGIDLTIAVNLSARNLLDDRIVEQIERMLIEYALPPNALELEITETALMQDTQHASLLLDRLATLGVRVAVDDFGTGYSSLAYLRRLPLAALKIDRTFISEMLDKPQDLVIVQSIISLAHNLGLEVVAEGLESAAVLDCLRAMGCDQGQGYHLSRPIPAAQMAAWLQNFDAGSVD